MINGLTTFIIKSKTALTITATQRNYLLQNGWTVQSNGNITKLAPVRAYYMLNMVQWLKTNNIPYEMSNPIGKKTSGKPGGG